MGRSTFLPTAADDAEPTQLITLILLMNWCYKKWPGKKQYLHTVLNNMTLSSTKKLSKLVHMCRIHSKPKQCHFRDTIYNMTKPISGVHVSPDSAETLGEVG